MYHIDDSQKFPNGTLTMHGQRFELNIIDVIVSAILFLVFAEEMKLIKTNCQTNAFMKGVAPSRDNILDIIDLENYRRTSFTMIILLEKNQHCQIGNSTL